MEKIARLSRDKLPIFCTLTYGADFPDDARARRDLRTLVKRLKRKFPKLALLWRLEHQKRGAPHFHVLFWGVSFIAAQWLRDQWAEVIGYSGEHRLQLQIEQIRNSRGVMAYVSKYLAKVDAGRSADTSGQIQPSDISDRMETTTGRVWGIMGSEYMPWDVLEEIKGVLLENFYIMKYYAGQVYGPAGEGHTGFVLYLDDSYKWVRWILTLAETIRE